MTTQRIWNIIGWGLLVIIVWYMLHIYMESPNQLVVHFGTDGRPNGWMSKQGFLLLMLGLVLVSNLLLRQLMKIKITSIYISIPYKNYWTATPERQAIAQIKVQTLLLQVIATMNALWVFTCYVIYNYNEAPLEHSADPTIAVIIILSVAAWLVGSAIREFLPPK